MRIILKMKNEEKEKKKSAETHLKSQSDDVELPEGLRELQPLVAHAAVTGQADHGAAAEAGYKQTKPQQLHVGVKYCEAAGHRRLFLIDRFTGNAQRVVTHLFIRIPEETGKPLAGSWKAAETAASD